MALFAPACYGYYAWSKAVKILLRLCGVSGGDIDEGRKDFWHVKYVVWFSVIIEGKKSVVEGWSLDSRRKTPHMGMMTFGTA